MHVLPCSLLNFLPHRNIYADKAALPCGITVRVVYKFRESSGVEGPEEILSEMLCWDSKFGRRKSAISTAWNKNHVFPVTLWRMIVGRVKTKSKTILAVSGGAREKKGEKWEKYCFWNRMDSELFDFGERECPWGFFMIFHLARENIGRDMYHSSIWFIIFEVIWSEFAKALQCVRYCGLSFSQDSVILKIFQQNVQHSKYLSMKIINGNQFYWYPLLSYSQSDCCL